MNELLKALADSDREREAPPAVEMRLRASFRRKYKRRIWPYLAAVAALAAGIALLMIRSQAANYGYCGSYATGSVLLVATPARRAQVAQRPSPREVVTEFYPLMEDPFPLRAANCCASASGRSHAQCWSSGKRGSPGEIVQADVLVGQEGLPRAIRFVNASVNRP